MAQKTAARILVQKCVSEAGGLRRTGYGLLALLLASASLLLLQQRGILLDVAFSRQTPTEFLQEPPSPLPLQTPELLAVRGPRLGTRFRTEACELERQRPGSQRWNPYATGAGDREVLDLIELASDPEDGQPRVACIVYSTRSKRQLLRDSFAVWGQDCDSFLPFSDETWTDNASGFETIEVHPRTGPDNYNTIIAKMRMIFLEITRRLQAGELAFDFLVVSGDDAFWILPNLRSFLRSFPTEGVGVYLGHRFALNGDTQRIYASGGGYVINQLSLRAYVACPTPDKLRGFAEDVVLGDCLRAAGVPLWPTEDSFGRQRFHFAGPAHMAEMNYSSPTDNWIRVYHRPWLETMLMGINGISKSSVLFHSVAGDRRYEMHDWLYRKLACSGAEADAAQTPTLAPPPT